MASLLDKRFFLVVGKGGVGRSTVAAALADTIARRKRRTLLYECNANDRYGDFFGRPAVGPELTRLKPELYAVNATPASALEQYGLMILRFKRVYKMVFENRLTRAFLRAIPGLDDYALLGKAWWHTTELEAGRRRWDTVVFDMPASGHSLSMLRIPNSILDTVPEGPLTRDARSIRQLLTDPSQTAVILVTLAEEMPTNEARELTATLADELGIEVAQVVINQVYPERFEPGSTSAKVLDALAQAAPAAGDDEAKTDPELAALLAHSQLALGRRRLNQRYLTELAKSLPIPQCQLPYLFVPQMGPAELEHLAGVLADGLSGAADD
ncbi:MAG: ArsA-related P-loop ATPase [Haliangiales bacterium]